MAKGKKTNVPKIFQKIDDLDRIWKEFSLKDFVAKNLKLMLLIACLIVLTIENRYACDLGLREIAGLRKELEHCQNEELTISSEITTLSRQSSVKRMINERGIDVEESTTPPCRLE